MNIWVEPCHPYEVDRSLLLSPGMWNRRVARPDPRHPGAAPRDVTGRVELKKNLKGFTLIELMIVVAIIAIIAAIAIPSLLRSRIAANEQSASSGLKMLVSTQSTWCATDADGNGEKDYLTFPTHNLSHFYHQTNKAAQKIKLIDIAFAKADYRTSSNLFPKSGYVFYCLIKDETGVTTYAGRPRYKFGFAAQPAEYGTTGVRMFTVNEEGVVYSRDTGYQTFATILCRYPGTDPTNSGAFPGKWAPEGE